MCLAIIGKVIEIREPAGPDAFPQGLVDVLGIRRTVSFGLLPSAEKGDYVLVHAGFAIQKLDPKDAKKTLKLLRMGLPRPQGGLAMTSDIRLPRKTRSQ